MRKGLFGKRSIEAISPLRVAQIKWLTVIVWEGMLGPGLDPRYYITPPRGAQTDKIIAELRRRRLICGFSRHELDALRWKIYPFASGRPAWMQNEVWTK